MVDNPRHARRHIGGVLNEGDVFRLWHVATSSYLVMGDSTASGWGGYQLTLHRPKTRKREEDPYDQDGAEAKRLANEAMAQSYFTMQDTHPGVESMLMDDAHYSLQMLGSPRVGIRRLLKRLRDEISPSMHTEDARAQDAQSTLWRSKRGGDGRGTGSGRAKSRALARCLPFCLGRLCVFRVFVQNLMTVACCLKTLPAARSRPLPTHTQRCALKPLALALTDPHVC